MMWIPDTNVWIRYLNPQASAVKARFLMHPAERIHLCDVVKTELYYGAYKSRAERIHLCDVVKTELYYGAYKSRRPAENLALLEELGQGFPSLPFDGAAARHFGRIRADLAQAGTPIGPYDLQIAAIALTHGYILVTHNTREFSRVTGLSLEDWEI